MSLRMVTTLFSAILLLAGSASAQSHPAPSTIPQDAAWTRDYVAADTNPELHTQPPGNRDIKWDPRFLPLMRSAFHQRQWFWYDHHRFTPVPDLIRVFIGVPGHVTLDQNRYVTVTGCVPHDCTDGGMLWIDTGSSPAAIIFAATQTISSVTGGDDTHLWLFSSRPLNFTNLPAAFLASLDRWHKAVTSSPYNKEDITVATLVQPTGQQMDLTYATVFYQQNQPGTHPAGAQQ